MPIVTKENSREILASVLHPVLYVQGARGEMTVSTEQPEKHLFFKLPNQTAEDLGDPAFKRTYGLRYALCGGRTVDLGRAGCLGVCTPGGQQPEQEIDEMKDALGGKPFLVALRSDSGGQMELARLLIKKDVLGVEASGFDSPSEALVFFRLRGVREEEGTIIIPHKIIARVSCGEVLERFAAPPAPALVESLLKSGRITAGEAALAQKIPMADDITVEGDLLALLPGLIGLADRKQSEFGYQQRVRVGAAGIENGAGCLAAFEMGAAFVVMGSTGLAPMKLLKSCAYRLMKNFLIRMGADPRCICSDII